MRTGKLLAREGVEKVGERGAPGWGSDRTALGRATQNQLSMEVAPQALGRGGRHRIVLKTTEELLHLLGHLHRRSHLREPETALFASGTPL